MQSNNYLDKLWMCYPIKQAFLEILRPYDLSRFVTYCNLELSSTEKDKYLDFIYDVVDYPFWKDQVHQDKYDVLLYGIDTELLVSRIKDPAKYEKRYGYEYILKIGISIKNKQFEDNLYEEVKKAPTTTIFNPYCEPLDKHLFGNNLFRISLNNFLDNRDRRIIISSTPNSCNIIGITYLSLFWPERPRIAINTFCRYVSLELDLGLVETWGKHFCISYLYVSRKDQKIQRCTSSSSYSGEHIKDPLLTILINESTTNEQICI